jgi:translation initiation factor IF-2
MANLVLLVVDPADFVNSGDGGGTCLQPQTKEAMEVAQHAGLPVIVVMNKVRRYPSR